MKIAKYVLNDDGTVPEYVVDGGYFAVANDNVSPQDVTLVGVVDDDAPISAITDLHSYLISIGAESWVNLDGTPFDIDAAVAFMRALAE